MVRPGFVRSPARFSDTVWKVDGLSKNERVIYKYMNECQKRRTEELDRAIQILRSHTN